MDQDLVQEDSCAICGYKSDNPSVMIIHETECRPNAKLDLGDVAVTASTSTSIQAGQIKKKKNNKQDSSIRNKKGRDRKKRAKAKKNKKEGEEEEKRDETPVTEPTVSIVEHPASDGVVTEIVHVEEKVEETGASDGCNETKVFDSVEFLMRTGIQEEDQHVGTGDHGESASGPKDEKYKKIPVVTEIVHVEEKVEETGAVGDSGRLLEELEFNLVAKASAREAELNTRERLVASREAELNTRETIVAQREEDVAQRLRDVLSREKQIEIMTVMPPAPAVCNCVSLSKIALKASQLENEEKRDNELFTHSMELEALYERKWDHMVKKWEAEQNKSKCVSDDSLLAREIAVTKREEDVKARVKQLRADELDLADRVNKAAARENQAQHDLMTSENTLHRREISLTKTQSAVMRDQQQLALDWLKLKRFSLDLGAKVAEKERTVLEKEKELIQREKNLPPD